MTEYNRILKNLKHLYKNTKLSFKNKEFESLPETQIF